MKAVLVFCEGRHDVVFAQRSLGAHGGCEWVDRPVGELPSPFGRGRAVPKGLIARRFERQALEDLPLRDAARPPLPCFDAVVENTATGTMFVLVRTHGQDQSGACLELLQDLQDTFVDQPADTFDVSEYAAAFLFDANGEGVEAKVAAFRERYGARGLFRVPQEHSGAYRHHRGSSGPDGRAGVACTVRRGRPLHRRQPGRGRQRVGQRGRAAEGDHHGRGTVQAPGCSHVGHHRSKPASRAVQGVSGECGARRLPHGNSMERLLTETQVEGSWIRRPGEVADDAGEPTEPTVLRSQCRVDRDFGVAPVHGSRRWRRGSRRQVPAGCQARSTWNETTLRALRLNSTATRWMGCPDPRYLSA